MWVGIPWVTSGSHEWNGARPNLMASDVVRSKVVI